MVPGDMYQDPDPETGSRTQRRIPHDARRFLAFVAGAVGTFFLIWLASALFEIFSR